MMTATKLPTSDLVLRIPDGLAEDTRASLESVLKPIFADAEPLCVKARNIVVTDVADAQGMKLAGDTRKAIKAIRVHAEKQRKELKEEALRTGQAIDKIFRPFDDALSAYEAYLSQQENYAERVEGERRERVKAEREAAIAKLGVDPLHYNVVDMTDEAFQACIVGIEAQKHAAAEAAAKAEADRVAAEQAAAAERARVAEENARLRREAEEREAAYKAERKAAAKAQREAEAKARKEREAIEAKAKVEREARERAERELQVRQKAEADAKAAEAKAAAKAARAPDKQKIQTFSKSLREFVVWPELKTQDGQNLMTEISDRIEDLANWIDARAKDL